MLYYSNYNMRFFFSSHYFQFYDHVSLISFLGSGCYFYRKQRQQQRKLRLPAVFIQKQQKLCWPQSGKLTHESFFTKWPHLESVKTMNGGEHITYVCLYADACINWIWPYCYLSSHGNHHNKETPQGGRWG